MYDPKKVESVCSECERQTKIVYAYDGHFFAPKLKAINFLEMGRSSMITNPITIFIELLLAGFFYVRNKLTLLNQFLFPKPTKLYGTKKDTAIVGKLTFATRQDLDTPIPVSYTHLTLPDE